MFIRLLTILLLLFSLPGAFAQSDVEKRVRALTPNDIPPLIQKAQAGEAASQYMLGLAYELGVGVVKNDAEAVSWYRKAAEQGYIPAQLGLAKMFSSGGPVTIDEAMRWLRKAAGVTAPQVKPVCELL